MRRELSNYILGLSVLTAIVFTVILFSYFERGLDSAARTTMLMEARAFEKRYLQDPSISPSSSNTTRVFLDNWQNAPELYQKLIPFEELEPGDFSEAEWSPHGPEQWQDLRYLIIYWHKLHDGRDLFVVTDFEANLLTAEEQQAFDQDFEKIPLYASVYLVAMLFVVWVYNRRINRYSQQLAGWAEALTLDNLNAPRPDFRYTEFNRIAEQLQDAFSRIASLMEREHNFLRHASHELRTPIAVIRTNVELLEKLEVSTGLARPFDRIRRANQTMLQLTETLLWLSRENDTPPQQTTIDPAEMLEQLTAELSYLLEGKNINLLRHFPAEPQQIELATVPFQIVVGNLLRNAFQYTGEGTITLTVDYRLLVIENRETGNHHHNSDDSFGLGLMLVKKICDKLNWALKLEFQEGGVRAELMLPHSVSSKNTN